MSVLDETAERLKEVGKLYGGFNKFAQLLNMSPQGLTPYWTGRSMPGAKIQERLRQAGIDVNYILTGKKSFNSVAFPVNQIGVFVPMVKNVHACINPQRINEEENVERYIFVSDWFKKENCYCVRVVGDSMVSPDGNKSIPENEILLIDVDAQINPGDIVVTATRNGWSLVKQYMPGENKDTIVLRSFNPTYFDLIIQKEDIELMHRVMLMLRPPKRI